MDKVSFSCQFRASNLLGHDVSEDHPILDWKGEVPVALAFDDPYFSLANGLEETRHVFLEGNCLPERFVPGFHIGELGFGTGLNLLTAWKAWRDAGIAGPLRFTSFERFPMKPSDMARAHRSYPEILPLSDELLTDLTPWGADLPTLQLRIVQGDARETVLAWSGEVDAWFLDGFSPAKNPEMWEDELLAAVARHTVRGGSAATYSAAGAVRRGLEAGGFEVVRKPGYGRKRHMTVARLP